ncbi:gmc oxidoreductase protein [Rutstroemia sp. NJR-2017a WRK4]|nr:gmc oxidoreductase protein [Rutstroemia sp. NJR-2017a WRK4]
MKACPKLSLFLALACAAQSSLCSYSESITGFNTVGDHFGSPPLGNATYDYVVIGGGTAGLTIAARLAHENAGTVAVIEAGGFYEIDNSNRSSVPGTAAYFIGTAPLFKNALIDWEYQTEPDSGLGGRSILYNSGKTLGGGSARNYMIYDRGSKGSYQKWADDVGDSSYSLDQFLPFFKKSVQLGLPNNGARAANASIHPNAGAYGTTGPLKVSFSSWANTFGSFPKLALAELGLKELPDFVSGNLYGYQYSSQTIDSTTQTRSSSETSYLRWAISSNSQLQVYKSTLAKRILFDSDKRATGVLVDTAGSQYSILANKEVILSAGAHRSPQLLMVSGIGPQDTLQKFGIPVLSNLAGVGQNLWDQPFFGPSYPVTITTHSSVATPQFMAQQIEAYRTSRTGFLTNPGSDFLAWENLPTDLLNTLSNKTRHDLATQFPKDWPTLQHTFADAYYGTGYDMLIGAPTDGRQYVSILPTIVATFSRGNITINSTDTSDNPIISPNMLSDPRDQEIAVAAFKRARQMFTTKSLKRILTGSEAYPGIDVASDADILSHIMKTTCPIWHASSSCKMGMSNDSMAVVDSQARVFGVTGLRVVDSSAFPFLIPSHPQATVCEFSSPLNHATALGTRRDD